MSHFFSADPHLLAPAGRAAGGRIEELAETELLHRTAPERGGRLESSVNGIQNVNRIDGCRASRL